MVRYEEDDLYKSLQYTRMISDVNQQRQLIRNVTSQVNDVSTQLQDGLSNITSLQNTVTTNNTNLAATAAKNTTKLSSLGVNATYVIPGSTAYVVGASTLVWSAMGTNSTVSDFTFNGLLTYTAGVFRNNTSDTLRFFGSAKFNMPPNATVPQAYTLAFAINGTTYNIYFGTPTTGSTIVTLSAQTVIVLPPAATFSVVLNSPIAGTTTNSSILELYRLG